MTKGRNILGRPSTSRAYTLEDIDPAFIASHDILHLERADEISHRLADIIHEAGGLVAFDGDGYSDATQAMLPKIDIFIGSEFYYNTLFGEGGPAPTAANMNRTWLPSVHSAPRSPSLPLATRGLPY